MFRLPLLALVLTSAALTAQDTKKDEPPAKAKGFLPANWRGLGLSEDQKQATYKIQTKYTTEIDKLTAKIAALKAEEKDELLKVLTPEQKAKLVALKTGEKPADKEK